MSQAHPTAEPIRLRIGLVEFSSSEAQHLRLLQLERMEREQNFDLCEVVKSLIHEALRPNGCEKRK